MKFIVVKPNEGLAGLVPKQGLAGINPTEPSFGMTETLKQREVPHQWTFGEDKRGQCYSQSQRLAVLAKPSFG